MASHFKRPGDEGRSGAQVSQDPITKVRGGFIPVMTEPEGKRHRHDRRRKEPHFVETDPYDLSGRRSRDPRKRIARVLSTLLFIVGLGLLATAAGLWFHKQWQYAEQDEINEHLATYVDPSSGTSGAPEVDWEGLKAENAEVVGWLRIPGTVVDFPVYQASDNEKYLTTSYAGTYSVGGQIFLDCENAAPGLVDMQSIVYGHHLRNGAMFKPISDMENQEMFDGVSTVWYATEQGTYELEPLLTYRTDENDEAVRQFNFETVDELRAYLTGLLDKASSRRADAADAIARTDRVLTLCTCSYGDDEYAGRVLLVCVPKAAQDEAQEGAEA